MSHKAAPSEPVGRKHLDKVKDEVVFRPHQIEGVRKLHKMQSFLLADEMRLGKSLQALTVAAIDFQAGVASRVLIVSPASVKWNWAENEIERHTNFSCLVLDGTKLQRMKQLARYVEERIDILIVNYEQVKSHLEDLNDIGFDIAILDEAHYIKGHKSARTKACQSLVARRFMLLTGSPMLNHVDDLWSLLYRIAPSDFPKYYSFLNRFAVYGGYNDKAIIGVKNERELNAKLAAHMLRRERKETLGHDNEKERIPILVDLSPEQKKLYDEAKDELKITIPDSPNPMELENALTKMLRLKQITGTTATIEGYEDHSTKLDVATDRTRELIESGERIVIFTQFRKVAECMGNRVRRIGGMNGKIAKDPIPVYELHGDVPVSERVAIINEWANNERPGVLIAMIQVAGVGLNMSAADTCIFLDKVWAPKLNEQAEDRLIGMDKDRPVSIIEIITRKTVEQRVEAILRRKSSLFGSIVSDDKWKKKLLESIIDEEDLAA